jgi:peptidoglycan/LPS O-acetylase OafA/YrhL
MFIIGILLAIYRDNLSGLYKKLSNKNKVVLLLGGLCFYTMQIALGHFIHSTALFLFTSDWIIAIGATIFIVASLSSNKISKVLNIKIVEFFGKISYSLYLYHLPIIFASLYFFNGKLPLWLTFVIAVSVSIFIATLSWKFIENYSIKLGKNLANKITKGQDQSNQKSA